MCQQFLGLGGIDKSHRHANHQIRAERPQIDQFHNLEQGRGGVAHGDDADVVRGRPRHGRLRTGGALGLGQSHRLRFGHPANHPAAKGREQADGNAAGRHVDIHQDITAAPDRAQTGRDRLGVESEGLGEAEITSGVDDAADQTEFLR